MFNITQNFSLLEINRENFAQILIFTHKQICTQTLLAYKMHMH